MTGLPSYCIVRGVDLELRVKAVPGAKQMELVGALGDRLKVRVNAPPEGGKANDASCALIAARASIKERDVSVTAGASSPQQTLLLKGAAARVDEIVKAFAS